MMKRVLQLALVCALVVSLGSIAAAQAPTPVTRMGDWVEIGNDVYMNFIGNTRIVYQTGHNNDYEDDMQDRSSTRANQSTTAHTNADDLLYQESRLGFDLKFQKNLRARILLEQQMTLDGNNIDNGFDLAGNPSFTQEFSDGRNLACSGDTGNCLRRNTVNLERAWIQLRRRGAEWIALVTLVAALTKRLGMR